MTKCMYSSRNSAGLPSHKGSGLKYLILSMMIVTYWGLPSHEGSGLKYFSACCGKRVDSLPSHEGSGLKSFTV